MEKQNQIQIHCLYDKLVDPRSLENHPKNRNKHPTDQIDRLSKIIEYQGWRYAIKVSKRSSKITSGHGRKEAALRSNWPLVPVVYQDYESEEQEYADVQADNAIASWAELDLAGIQNDALDFGPDFNVDLLGIKDFVLESAEQFEPQSDEDSVPENVETRCKLGDVWTLGRHRLMCGDSILIDNFRKLTNYAKIDMVFTDPPYGMMLNTDYKGSLGDNGYRTAKSYKPVEGDDKEFNFLDFYSMVEVIPEQFWWGADYYCQTLPKDGSWFVWNKRTTEGLQKMYGNHFELCWSKAKHQREIAEITWAGAFGHNKTDDGPNKVHPTMKPIKLISWFFEKFKGENVLDLFGGSGSTMIACEKANRNCFMMELDPHYCDVILKRWETYTGKTAELTNGQNG